MINLLNSSFDLGSLFKRDEVTASAISVCFAPVLRPWNVKRTLFGDTFETLLKNVPQIEELSNIPCKCLCDANKKLENGHADVMVDANYSDHSYSDALVVWQKCARHMYHHYLCQLLQTCQDVDRGGGRGGGGGRAGGGRRVRRVDNELHAGVTRDILYLSLFIIAEEDHDCYMSTISRPNGVLNRDRGKDPCADGELCRLNCTDVKYVYECCLGRADGAAGGGAGAAGGGGSSRRGGGRGRMKEASSIVTGNGSSSSSGNGRSRSHSSLVIVRDIISDCLSPAHTANTAILCAAYGCYKEALEACRQHLLMHPPQQQQQQQQQRQCGPKGWHCSTADSEEEAKNATEVLQSRGGGSDLRERHMCIERNEASIDGVPSVRSVLLRCLQIAVSRLVTHTLSVLAQGLPDPNTFSSSFQPSLSQPVRSSPGAVSTDADEKRRIEMGVDIADDVVLAVKLLWVLLAREVRRTGAEVDPEKEEGIVDEEEEEKTADGAVKITIETIVACMMSSPVCLCASALESTEALDQTGITHTIQHEDHLRNCLQTAWTIGPIKGVCEDLQIKTWTLDLLSHSPATEPDLSFNCYSMDTLRGTVALSLSKCVLAALGPHLTSHFVRALPSPFFDRLDLDFIAELVVD